VPMPVETDQTMRDPDQCDVRVTRINGETIYEGWADLEASRDGETDTLSKGSNPNST
jgi:hypothetical protein